MMTPQIRTTLQCLASHSLVPVNKDGTFPLPYVSVDSCHLGNDLISICTPSGERLVCLASELHRAIENATNWGEYD